MFTRTVEVTTKSGKARELSNTINDKVLPILKKQTGFVDETLLVSDTEPDRVLAISFWTTKEDAERYHQEQYPPSTRWSGTCWSRSPPFGPSMSIPRPHTRSQPAKLPESNPDRG